MNKGKNEFNFPIAAASDANKTKRANITVDGRASELIKLAEDMRSLERIRSAHDVQRVQGLISSALDHLPGPVTPAKLTRMDDAIYIDWKSIAIDEYATILEEAVRLFDDTWPTTAAAIDPRVIRLFSIDHSADFVITSLVTILSKTSAPKFGILARVFEECLHADTWLASAFIDLSHYHSTSRDRQSDFVQLLASTPNRVANHFKSKIPNTFMDGTYSAILSLALIKALHFTVHANSREKSDTFKADFFASLFSRLVIDFNANRTSRVLPKVVAILAKWSEGEDYQPMIQQMMLRLNRNAMEVVAMYVLETDHVDHLLGDAVSLSDGWAHILQSRLPFAKPTSDSRITKNLIEHLASRLPSEAFNRTVSDLARCWASKSYINTQTLDEHIFLTKLVVLGVHQSRVKESPEVSKSVKMIIQRGVQNHMECLQSTVRALGMVTAELVMNYLSDFKVDEELHFEYDSFSDYEKAVINDLMAIPNRPISPQEIDIDAVIGEIVAIGDAAVDEQLNKVNIYRAPADTMEVDASLTTLSTGTATILAQPLECDEIDSDDDDLTPYSLSNDTAQAEDKSPRYLIDLRDALQDTDDPDAFEQCMISSATLIAEKLPHDISDMDIQLLRLFIGLEQRFYMENFEQHRFTACLAICCVRPKQCAEYLCTEFHSDAGRYAVSKKVLMLDVLSEAARELAKLNVIKTEERSVTASRPVGKLVEICETKDTLAEARRVISERIQRKTRRFAHRTAAAYQNEQVNRFAPVAGDFFFPLVYGLSKQHQSLSRHWLKHDTDNILLCTLLHTIATVVLAAQNCPIITKIAPETFELSTMLRFHPEAKVREGVLKVLAATLMATPIHLLQMHCAAQLNELRSWLEQCLSFNVIRGGEKNADCRELATHVLAMCANALSQ